MRGAVAIVAAFGASVGALAPARGAAAPDGVEFRVNEHTAGAQKYPSVALAGDGGFVVVWYSDGQDGDGQGVFGRRFASAGAPLGPELQINTFTTGNQQYPRVAVAPDGGFVVAWNSAQDGDYYGVFARRFESSGAALAAEFQVNLTTVGGQGYPALAFDAGGGFVVTWLSNSSGTGDIFARRYDADGVAIGGELQANTYTPQNQFSSDVAVSADGDFTIVWQSGGGHDGNLLGVFGRRFDASGAPKATEFQVNSYTSGSQGIPRIAMRSDGAFVVVWQSGAQDGGSSGVFAQRFGAGGAPIGVELQVNAYTFGDQFAPAVAIDEDGGFIVAWTDGSYDGSLLGVFARRFDPSGAGQPPFQVNTYTALYQHSASVARGAGDFVIAWHSKVQDGSDYGVFAQRYAGSIDFDVDGDGAALPLTDGLLILRYLFGFRGAVLINGAVGAGCTRCDAPSIEAYCEAHL
jgi:hypothetical protein